MIVARISRTTFSSASNISNLVPEKMMSDPCDGISPDWWQSSPEIVANSSSWSSAIDSCAAREVVRVVVTTAVRVRVAVRAAVVVVRARVAVVVVVRARVRAGAGVSDGVCAFAPLGDDSSRYCCCSAYVARGTLLLLLL